MWATDWRTELLPTNRSLDDLQLVKVPKAMYVPSKYIRLFVGKGLTSKDLSKKRIRVWYDEQTLILKPFINWMVACVMSTSKE
jgi:hypothetical protein